MVDWVNKIEAANAVWMKNFAEGNAKGVGEMYTEDCKVMPTGSDVVVGREGASSVFGGAMSSGVKSVLLKTDEVGPLNTTDTAYERGHYTFYKEDGSVLDEGKYVVVWKNVGGSVLMDVDIWNSNK